MKWWALFTLTGAVALLAEPPAMNQSMDLPDLAARMHRGVTGTAHDFSDPRTGAGVCNACHVPHMQAIRPTTQPTATQPSFEAYRVPGQRRVFEPGRFSPGPTSLVCLGCHDGTVAMSTLNSSHALLAGVREGFDLPGGFVWRDHPIGIPYVANHREFRSESYVLAKGIKLPQGRLECISCHDPHNQAGFAHLLSVSNRRSALCLTCHIK